MSLDEIRVSQAQLLEVTVRLAEEFPDLPAGSVMRCVARVVWQQRRLGTPDVLLTSRSEDVARRLLTERLTGVPAPATRAAHALSA